MHWTATQKSPATETSNQAIEQKLDRIIELLEEIASPHQRVVEQLRNSHKRPKRS
ncbi:DUF4083 family protein [Rothia nasimurium]|uniref:DUF4083 family protein n=1 Tax=Rothia nasimurium TaxID=85336 RepID=UPI0036073767